MQKSFAGIDENFLSDAEYLASFIFMLAGDSLTTLCADYRWTCERLLEEEIHFRRFGNYRLKFFADAQREVYEKPDFMAPYLNGLLLSQLRSSKHQINW